MKILKNPAPVTVTFSPDEYWLKKSDQEWQGEYMLVVKIDRSYAGKEPDEGAPVLYMSSSEAEEFRKAGFNELM